MDEDLSSLLSKHIDSLGPDVSPDTPLFDATDFERMEHSMAMAMFLSSYRIKETVFVDGNLGCPHEEGEDFPVGEDCPFCPFWAGKQGSKSESF